MQVDGGNLTQYTQAMSRAATTAGNGTNPKIRTRRTTPSLKQAQYPSNDIFSNRINLLPAGSVPQNTMFGIKAANNLEVDT